MSWFLTAILGYLLLALVSITDKHLLSDKIDDPKRYALYTGLLRGAIVVIIPFIDFQILTWYHLLVAFASGGFFYSALFFLYQGIKKFEVSRMVPTVGALVPVFSLFLVFCRIRAVELVALLFLIGGGLLINYQRGIKRECLLLASMTSLSLASHFILAKELYNNYSFLTSLVWINLGSFLVALLFLPFSRGSLSSKGKGGWLFLLNKGLAAIGGLLQNLSIYLAPSVATVAIINGLRGSQEIFLLLLAPGLLREEVNRSKLLAIFLIIIGMVILGFIQ